MRQRLDMCIVAWFLLVHDHDLYIYQFWERVSALNRASTDACC